MNEQLTPMEQLVADDEYKTDVDALNAFQRGLALAHEFTCEAGHEHGTLWPVDRDGVPWLVCERCGYEQDATLWMPMVRERLRMVRVAIVGQMELLEPSDWEYAP